MDTSSRETRVQSPRIVRDAHQERSPLTRYVLYQIPGWLLAALGGLVLYRVVGVSGWIAVALPIVWTVKDAALYPLLKSAYQTDDRPIIERLVGLEGVAVEALAPRGYVRVRGELWRAESSATVEAVDAGEAIRVTAIRGTTLVVAPARAAQPQRA